MTPLVGLLAFGGYYTVSPIFERTTLIEASPLEALLASSAGSGVATDGEIKSEAEEAAQDDGNVTLLTASLQLTQRPRNLAPPRSRESPAAYPLAIPRIATPA